MDTIWILYGSYMDHISIVHGSLHGSLDGSYIDPYMDPYMDLYIDPIWILYEILYGSL